MNNSWCAVRNGPVLVNPTDIETSFTDRHGFSTTISCQGIKCKY